VIDLQGESEYLQIIAYNNLRTIKLKVPELD